MQGSISDSPSEWTNCVCVGVQQRASDLHTCRPLQSIIMMAVSPDPSDERSVGKSEPERNWVTARIQASRASMDHATWAVLFGQNEDFSDLKLK